MERTNQLQKTFKQELYKLRLFTGKKITEADVNKLMTLSSQLTEASRKWSMTMDALVNLELKKDDWSQSPEHRRQTIDALADDVNRYQDAYHTLRDEVEEHLISMGFDSQDLRNYILCELSHRGEES